MKEATSLPPPANSNTASNNATSKSGEEFIRSDKPVMLSAAYGDNRVTTFVKLDARLKSLLRSHQLEAYNFLLNRLMNYLPIDASANSISLSSTVKNTLCTGAVFADDMGTGKVYYRYTPLTILRNSLYYGSLCRL